MPESSRANNEGTCRSGGTGKERLVCDPGSGLRLGRIYQRQIRTKWVEKQNIISVRFIKIFDTVF